MVFTFELLQVELPSVLFPREALLETVASKISGAFVQIEGEGADAGGHSPVDVLGDDVFL